MLPSPNSRSDLRFKMSKLQVLIADGDARSSTMVKTILHSFGMRKVDVATNAREAMQMLRSRRIDLLIVEWVLDPVDGVNLVKAIRAAKSDRFLQHDMPIMMLTAYAGQRHVEAARDAGTNEFVAKPFSARTISTRLIELIDNPRSFVETPTFKGPSRRRKGLPPPGSRDRRVPLEVLQRQQNAPKVSISKANTTLQDLMGGTSALDIITAEVIEEAQVELMKGEGEFVEWVREDIARLERAYAAVEKRPTDMRNKVELTRVSYTIKAQSGVFGYELGTIVADLLISYLDAHDPLNEQSLIVVRKHIDTLAVIFSQQVKDPYSPVGLALIESLNKLVAKFD